MNKFLLLLTTTLYLSTTAIAQQPNNLTVNTINPTDVDLSWDNNGCTANYSLRYKENGAAWSQGFQVTIGNTGGTQAYNLSGLTNLTTYNWKVKCGGVWSVIDTFSTPSSCPSTISQSNTGFHINPVYGYGNNPQYRSIDTLSITNLSNCDLNIRPDFIISHQDSAIEQGDLTLKFKNPLDTTTWAPIPYIISNGDAIGFWSWPDATDSTGFTLNVNQSTHMPVRIHFNLSQFNPNQNVAPLGNYLATWNTQEVDSLGNIIQTLATNNIALALVDCSTFSIDSTNFTNNNCIDSANGSATIFSLSGSGQYSYLWSDGQTIATAINLAAGTYSCLVTDNNWGCLDSVSITISEPSPLNVTLTGTNVTCIGNNDGTLAGLGSGGSGSYNYQLNGALIQNPNLSGLSPLLYTLTLTDRICGGNVTANLNISEPDLFQSNTIISQNFSCDSLNCSGSVNLNLSGGNTPYSIFWVNGDTVEVRNNLCAGAYTITVNDSNSTCPSLTINANISNTPSLPLVAISGQNISCLGNVDGSASISKISSLSYCASAPGDNNYSNIELVRIIGDGDSIVNNTAGACDTYEDYTAQYTTLNPGQPYSVDVNLGSCNPTGGAIDSAGVFIDWNIDGDFTDPGEMIGVFGGIQSPTSNTISFIVPNGYYGATRMRVVSQAQYGLSGPVTSCDVGTLGLVHPWYGATEDYTIVINSSNPSSYLWNTGDTTQEITGLLAGTYYCTLTDNSGCSNTDTIEIIEPSAINVTESITHIDCNGANNGTVTLFVTGGSSPYIINWNGSDTNALTGGQHNYTISDNFGCIFSDSILINEPLSINISSTITNNISCAGFSDGAIDISINGDTGVYFYSWTGPNGFSSSDSNITNLFSGEYIVTVNDINTCSAKDTITIDPVASLLITLNNTSDQTSCAPFDGSINISVSGGSGTYSYSWSNGDTTEDITNLSANTYILYLSDSNNCFIQDTFTINSQTIPILVSLDSSNYNGYAISCNNYNDGYLAANTSGGLGDLSLLWSNGSSNDTIFNLTQGLYEITVSDSIGCSNSESIYIHEPQEISAYRQQAQGSCISQTQNIGITLVITGGTPGYTENWYGVNPDSLILNTQYTYTITDTNNCSLTDTFTLNLATPLIMIASETDVACYGDSTGAAYFQVSGGIQPYSYLWSNGDITAIATNLPEGFHTCTVIDNNGCSKTDSTIISQPSLPIFTILNVIDSINCYGDNTGIANIYVTGGVSPYNLIWSNLITDTISLDSIATNLNEGFAFCTITDDNNCILKDSVYISQNDSLYTINTISNYNNYSITCNGLSDASINISIVGGFGPFNLKWNNVADSTYIDSLPQGAYDLEIEDSLGCQFSMPVTITEPNQISVIKTHEDASCYGYNDGSLSFSINGGVPSYSISGGIINPSVSLDTISIDSIYAGYQIFTIIDQNNCIYIDTIIISEPSVLIGYTILSDYNGVNIRCKGQSNGFIILDSISGGNSPYNFYWTNVNGDSLINIPINDSLSVGNYSLNINDSLGCTNPTQNFLITEPNFALISYIDSVNVTCNNDCNGTLIPTTFDGTPPYNYSWTSQNGFSNLNDTINNLCPGNYDLLVTDANECINTLSSIIIEPNPVSIQLLTLINVSIYGNNDGFISVQANGGNGNFSYSWDNGEITNSINNLTSGQYEVVVIDSLGCSDSSSYFITEPLAISLNFDSINSSLSTSCYDSCNGSIYINPVFSPLATFTTYWNSPNGFSSTNEDIFNLCAGIYNLAVISGLDSTHFIFEVLEPDNLETSIYTDSSNICFNSNALLTAYTYGGTLPYSFAWSDSTTNISATFSAGTHSVKITDANGCFITDSITLLNPDTMNISTLTTPISCHNGSDGSFMIFPSGGTAPYLFSVNNGISYQSIDDTIQNVSAGTYMIKVKDSNNCSQNINITITNPPLFTAIVDIINDVSCNGLCDGGVTFAYINAIGMVTRDWGTNSPPPPPCTGLYAGTYSCLLKDSNGCTTTVDNIIITQPDPLVLTLSSNQDTTTCNNNGDDGSAQAIIQGGTPSLYIYSWSNGGSNSTISNLIPGLYNVSVTDGNGCSIDDNITIINNPTLFLIGIEYNNDTLTVDTSNGGMEPYTYEWDTGETTQNIEAPANGQYWVIATDAFGCISDTAFYNVNDHISSTTTIESNNIKIFPNPTTGKINIDSEDIITGLSLVNNIGEEVLNNYLASFRNISRAKLDISKLPRGMYFIRLKVNNQIINHKILLQ
jgi:hypothetical protein